MIPAILADPAAFEDAQRETLLSEITNYPTRSWWPSSLGHPCDRALVWNWTRREQRRPHDWVLQSIFDEGNLHERGTARGANPASVYDRLEAMGFEVIRQYDRSLEWRGQNGAIISGKPDGKLISFRGEKFPESIPFDAKSLAGHTWNRLDSYTDLVTDRDPIVRGYPCQANLYGFLDSRPVCGLVLKNKATGVLKPIFWELDYQAAEVALSRAERLQPLVDGKVDPPPIAYTSQVCGRCGFNAICYPPRTYGEGARVIEDTELADALAEMARTDEGHATYEAAKRRRNKILEREGMKFAAAGEEKTAICGEWIVTATARAVKGYTLQPRVDTIYDARPLGGE